MQERVSLSHAWMEAYVTEIVASTHVIALVILRELTAK